MSKSGLADSPFFAAPKPEKVTTPPSRKAAGKKDKERSTKKRRTSKSLDHKSTSQSTDQSTSQSTDQSTNRPTDRSTDQLADPLTDVEALDPMVERPRAFYITQKVDRWLDEAVRYLKEKGLHKADRSVLVNALLHNPDLFLPSSLDDLRSRLLAQLTNKSLKRSQSTN